MSEAPFVVVCGGPGEARDRVGRALRAARMPFIHADPAPGRLPDGWWPARMPSAVVLIDPAPEGWRLADALGAPGLLVLFRRYDPSQLAAGLVRGVRAVVRGADVATDLPVVVELVAHGYFAMPQERIDELAGWLGLPAQRSPVPELTGREADILDSIASGHTVRQTARALGIAVKTVENTQARLFRKLGARNRSGALTIAYRLGLVGPLVESAGRGAGLAVEEAFDQAAHDGGHGEVVVGAPVP